MNVATHALTEVRPGEPGSVCAMTWVTGKGPSVATLGAVLPCWFYTVEYGDGSDELIPETRLEPWN